jgi:hypothetical protein
VLVINIYGSYISHIVQPIFPSGHNINRNWAGNFADSIDSDAIVKYRYEYKGDPEIEAGRLPFCEFIDRINQPVLYPGGTCTAVAGWAHLSQEISRFENWFMGVSTSMRLDTTDSLELIYKTGRLGFQV